MKQSIFTALREMLHKPEPVAEITDPVASIGDQNYATLEDALLAARKRKTITLLKDSTMPATVDIKKKITLDLNSKTLTVIGALLINKVTFTGKGVVHFG